MCLSPLTETHYSSGLAGRLSEAMSLILLQNVKLFHVLQDQV